MDSIQKEPSKVLPPVIGKGLKVFDQNEGNI